MYTLHERLVICGFCIVACKLLRGVVLKGSHVCVAQAVSDADFVIEAVTENMAVKRAILERCDQLAPKHAILASNTSSISISKSVQYQLSICFEKDPFFFVELDDFSNTILNGD